MTHCHMTYLDTKKVLKGRQVDMSFGLAWLCWATNTEEIIFNGLTELQEILLSEWQSSVSTKPKLVDLEDSHGSAVQWNKHCNPPPEQSRIHLEIYTVRRQFTGTLWNYEWPAIQQDQPNRVVYVGIARAHVVAIMNHWKAESLGTAIMVIIKQLW